MSNLIKECIIKGFSETALKGELYEICERVHSSCDSDCPVYVENGYSIPWNSSKSNCTCFKDSKKMLEFLKDKYLTPKKNSTAGAANPNDIIICPNCNQEISNTGDESGDFYSCTHCSYLRDGVEKSKDVGECSVCGGATLIEISEQGDYSEFCTGCSYCCGYKLPVEFAKKMMKDINFSSLREYSELD